MGWDFDRAEEEATRLLADYSGEPEVTDDGVVIYVFKELRKTPSPPTTASAGAAPLGLGWRGSGSSERCQ